MYGKRRISLPYSRTHLATFVIIANNLTRKQEKNGKKKFKFTMIHYFILYTF